MNSKDKIKHVITCPNCGAEYLPAEIYIPKEFFGDPGHIERDNLMGTIEFIDGKNMDTHENYVCDRCFVPFIVNTSLMFTTRIDVKNDFSNNYVTKLQRKRLKLKED